MLTRDKIKSVFNVEAPVTDLMNNAIDLWSDIYSNQAPWLSTTVKSLNLGAAIANEIARIVTIEAKVIIEGSARGEFLNSQMETILDDIRQQLEHGVALGGMIFKPYIDETNQIVVDYVQADSFYPVEFDGNGNLTAVIFQDKRKLGNYWFTKYEFHQLKGTTYTVVNKAYKSSDETSLGQEVPLTVVDEWSLLEPIATLENIEKPLFAYFRYPGANIIDRNSPLGVSCYARAVDLIQQADEQWSNFLWEFESGKRALYVDILAFGRDSNNDPVLPNQRLYKQIDTGGSEDALFEDWSPTFRQTDLLMGLDAILRRIEFIVGLSYGTLSNPQSVEKTATEIVTAKQRTYSMVVDNQKALENSIRDLVDALDIYVSLYNLAPLGNFDITFNFDDSVIVDKDQQFQSDLRLVSAGIMPKYEFRMRNLGEDENVAKEMIANVSVENPPEPSLFG